MYTASLYPWGWGWGAAVSLWRLLHLPTDIKLYSVVFSRPPADMCGGVLTGLSGVISSPGYPHDYSNNADCSWTIHVSNTSVVTLVFRDFQLENNDGCNFDFVAMFDGPTVTHRHLGRYCGADKPPSTVTTSNQLLVVFKSDFNIGGRGFRAYYFSGTRWMEICGSESNVMAQTSTQVYRKQHRRHSMHL